MNKTQLMGIVNVTPDSFFAESRAFLIEDTIKKISLLINQGADWIDIGAESTRPYCQELSAEEELSRLAPLFSELQSFCSIPFSIDTRKAIVAKAAIEAGASMINDVAGFRDESMQQVAFESSALLCVMHMPTDPSTMQHHTHYEEGIIAHLLGWFEKRIKKLTALGISESRIIVDPGIGFGKTVDDNLRILQNLHKLKSIGFPILLGISRKSFMQKILSKSAEHILPATLALNSVALLSDIAFLRVHDVAEHRQVVDLLSYYKEVKEFKG